MIDCGGGWRAFRWRAVTFAHPFQENRLIAAVVDQVRISDLRKDAEEIVPYQLLLFCIVGPKTVLNASSAVPMRIPIR